MHVTVKIEGINLEKLLCIASEEGIWIARATRIDARGMTVRVRADQAARLYTLCERCGWTHVTLDEGRFMRLARFLRRRIAFAPGILLGILLVFLSSQMILSVRVENARENAAEIRRFFEQEGVHPGRLKAAFSLDELRAKLSHRLPGLSHAALRYAGSTLVCDVQAATEGEQLSVSGDGMDIVATQSGIVKKIWVSSGTPQVVPGQAVHKGQVLISGQERSEKGTMLPAKAQGQITARVFAGGEAKVSLTQTRSVETGETRTRVTLATPWSRRVVRDAQPFDSQDTSREIQRVVGLYLPVWREIETYARTQVFVSPRDQGDCASMAQGAAEKIAREQCPPDALILDKWVNYSMIDNEFIYARVVLEYEAHIAGRIQ